MPGGDARPSGGRRLRLPFGTLPRLPWLLSSQLPGPPLDVHRLCHWTYTMA